MLIPTLSLRQPWAYAVIHLGKPFENRDWKMTNPNRKFRGTFLLHASKSCTNDDQKSYEDLRFMCQPKRGLVTTAQSVAIPEFGKLERGGIVGIAEVVDAVSDHDLTGRAKDIKHEWYFGPFALVLDNVKPLPFTPCMGMLGFFRVDTTVLGLDSAIMTATHNRITQRAMAS